MPDKTALQAAIAAAPKAEDGAYYTANDRYNGKTSSSDGRGFWYMYQTALNKANSVNENATSNQDKIDAAVVNLQTAIANLIPADCANTTALYEALQSTPASNSTALAAIRTRSLFCLRDIFMPSRGLT